METQGTLYILLFLRNILNFEGVCVRKPNTKSKLSVKQSVFLLVSGLKRQFYTRLIVRLEGTLPRNRANQN